MEEYKCSVENFIKDTYSICREERQYAVFLYDVLRKYKDPEMDERKNGGEVSKIFNACSIPSNAKIEHVFYEPTFMRDFFERNRRNVLGEDKLPDILLQKTFSPSDYKMGNKDDSFNYQLIKYVGEKVCGISISDTKSRDSEEYSLEEYNLGGSLSEEFKQQEKKNIYNMIDEEFQKRAEVIQDRIRQMMNAKSDIAVVYSRDEGKEEIWEILFLECKFESGESSYKGSGLEECDETVISVTQRMIQWWVADFLCRYLKEKGESIKVAETMEEEKSCLVKFVRRKDKNKTQEIEIETLITLSKEIFFSQK